MRKLAVLASTIGFVLIGSVGSVSAATPPTCQIESPVTQVIGENCVYPPAPTTTIEAQIPPPPPATLPVTGADRWSGGTGGCCTGRRCSSAPSSPAVGLITPFGSTESSFGPGSVHAAPVPGSDVRALFLLEGGFFRNEALQAVQSHGC